jgi:L-threonylcarbamoyladenylate synthase
MAAISTDVKQAAAFLQHDVVAIPTETVYGLAANALDPLLVARIFEIKNRPSFDPLIVHVASFQQAVKLAREFPDPLRKLALRFWPGPLTLLVPKIDQIPDIVTSGLDRVGIRVPDHPLTLELLNLCGFPIAAPSANPFGYISPTRAEHVQEQLGEKIPMILDGGPCKVGVESTIVGMELEQLTVYRLGGIPLEEIVSVAGNAELRLESGSNPGAPGMLLSHYAPKKPLFIVEQDKSFSQEEIAMAFLIRFDKPDPRHNSNAQFVLSPSGDLTTAAVHLFEALHLAEKHIGSEMIMAQRVPETGIGRAINDRLKRAAFKRQ